MELCAGHEALHSVLGALVFNRLWKAPQREHAPLFLGGFMPGPVAGTLVQRRLNIGAPSNVHVVNPRYLARLATAAASSFCNAAVMICSACVMGRE
jgi:hypothetical protein